VAQHLKQKEEKMRSEIRKLQRFCFASAVLAILFLISVSAAAAFETQKSSANRVRVDVKPIQLTIGQPARFQVWLNTHFVALGDDLAAAAVLRDDQGHTYRATAWEGSPPGGHHRKGVLEFPKLEGSPASLTLIIKGVAGVPERLFRWELRG
jgi:hypothetical protein